MALGAWNWVCSHHYEVQAANSPSLHVTPPMIAPAVESTPRANSLMPANVGRQAAHAMTPTSVAAVAVAAANPTAAETAGTETAGATGCPNRRPYHTLLTTQATVYQQWQSRIMYHHFKKQRALDGTCTDMGGFTRLVASEGAAADGLEEEMPSVFVKQYTAAEIAKYGHFGVRAAARSAVVHHALVGGSTLLHMHPPNRSLA